MRKYEEMEQEMLRNNSKYEELSRNRAGNIVIKMINK